MSKPIISQNTLTSHIQPLDDGLNPEKLKLSIYPVTTNDSMITKISSKSQEPQNKKIQPPVSHVKESVTLEFPLPTKNMTSKDKSNISKNNVQTQKSSKISDPDSIGTEKEYSPFWTESLMEQSKKLWSPIKTDCVDSELNCYNGCSKNLTANSWFSVNLQTPPQKSNYQKTSFPLSTTLQQKIMECEVPKTERLEMLKARKIKLYPTTQEKEKLRKWFGAARWTYNKCLEHIRSEHSNDKMNKKILRSKFINKEVIQEKEYIKDVPYDIRDEAMADLIKNVKSNCAKIKRKTLERFQIKFRSLKYNNQSVSIRARHFFRNKGEYSFIKTMEKSEYIDHNKVNNDFRIIKDVYGDYWMCLPYKKKLRSDRQAFQFSKYENDGVISLDPGVRTFLTGYDGYQYQIVHLGTSQSTLEKLFLEIDLIESRMSNKKNKKRMKLRKACQQKRKKIKNLIKDMHYKLSNFLCANYKTILIPEFNTQDMMKQKEGRVIKKSTVRLMGTQSHYTFRQRLIEKSREYEHCNVIVVNESYTSKTCSDCGKLHKKLGSSKTYTCVHCGMEMDRDVNGAKNILLKNNI